MTADLESFSPLMLKIDSLQHDNKLGHINKQSLCTKNLNTNKVHEESSCHSSHTSDHQHTQFLLDFIHEHENVQFLMKTHLNKKYVLTFAEDRFKFINFQFIKSEPAVYTEYKNIKPSCCLISILKTCNGLQQKTNDFHWCFI